MNHREITVVNDVNEELPPGLKIEDLIPEVQEFKNWKEAEQTFTFGTVMKLDSRVPPVDPPDSLPEQFKEMPHEFVKELNCGYWFSSFLLKNFGFRYFPYSNDGKLHHAMSILYECGEWMGCSNLNCKQRVTVHPSNWNLQVPLRFTDNVLIERFRFSRPKTEGGEFARSKPFLVEVLF